MAISATVVIGGSQPEPPPPIDGLDITNNASDYTVATGSYEWKISKVAFSVFDYIKDNGVTRVSGASVGYYFETNGPGNTRTSFEAPSETSYGSDWVEVRGWANQTDNLWYICRYKFFDGEPTCHLAFSIMDRHDDYGDDRQVEGHWDEYWDTRFLQDLEIKITTPNALTVESWSQPNSYWGGHDTDDLVVTVIETANDGNPPHFTREDGLTRQLAHRGASGTSSLTVSPKYVGEVDVACAIDARSGGSAYLQSIGLKHVVTHSGGVDTLYIDQNASSYALGTYTLDTNSSVGVFTTQNGYQHILIGKIIFTPTNGDPVIEYQVDGNEVSDTTLSESDISFVVRDAARQHPVTLFKESNAMGLRAFNNEATNQKQWLPGIGKTFDIAISVAGTASAAADLMNTEPTPALPAYWKIIDGTLTPAATFDSDTTGFLSKFDSGLLYIKDGWEDWGDHTIGNSYNTGGKIIEDWANQQMDLPTTALLMWARHYPNNALWRRAVATVRFCQDIHIAKFKPLRDKYCSMGRRKGSAPRDQAHNGEPIPAFASNWRSLLWWYDLTGEEWAKDLAQMQIDNLCLWVRSAELSAARKEYMLSDDRAALWALKALVVAEEAFPGGTVHYSDSPEWNMPIGTSYVSKANWYVGEIATDIIANGTWRGTQPVWEGPFAAALCEYHRKYPAKANLTTAIQNFLTDFVNNQYNYNSGNPQIKYIKPSNWTDAGAYGLFWVSALQYGYDTWGTTAYKTTADQLYAYCMNTVKASNNPRIWSTLGYVGDYLETNTP